MNCSCHARCADLTDSPCLFRAPASSSRHKEMDSDAHVSRENRQLARSIATKTVQCREVQEIGVLLSGMGDVI